MISYTILLFLLSNVLLLVQSSCTEGFMDLSLIQNNMAPPASSLSVNALAEEGNATRWIVTEHANKFNCTATLEEILIGVDIRTVNDTIGRNLYPRFEVWSRNNNNDDRYTREMSVDIILTPDNFTTNGLYRYRLPQLVNVYNEYRMGVYQPSSERSVVRFYATGSGSGFKKVGKILPKLINNSAIEIRGPNKEVDEQQLNILLHPVISPAGIIINKRNEL